MHETHPQRAGATRRSVMAAALTTGVLATLGPTASAATSSGATRPNTAAPTASWFARPATSARPRFRWWWPDGLVDPVEIAREVDQMADAGFGGAEIAAVHHSITDTSVLDTARHGWGSPAWRAGVTAALRQAARRGLTIDLTLGPSWPVAVPGVTPDDDAAVKELAYGKATLTAGAAYDGPVPASVYAAASGVTQQKLVAVQAARVNTAYSSGKATGLDAESVTDLTGQVSGGRLSWTPPDSATWVILSYWQRGSGQQPEAGPHSSPAAYVVDHFSAAGTAAVTLYWDSTILDSTLRQLLRSAGGTFFEDSVELETKGLQWTPGLPAAFREHTGRDLLPYLPAVVLDNGNQIFAFEARLTQEIRHDFWETVSGLFNKHHLGALTSWAHGHGMKMRSQPYGLQTDAIASAAVLDVPEGESLGFKNLDDYRCLAGGRDMAGHRILSCEAGAYAGGAYNTTWDKFLRTMGGAYAAGVNQTVIHGFSYATAPGVSWPGFAAFSPYSGAPGYGESWGPRQPTWRHVPDITAYLGRVHEVLQSGTVRADIAVFRQTGYTATGIGASWLTSTGVPLGWTHQFLSGPLLDLPTAKVSGRRLAPDGPAYKALFLEGDFFYGSTPTLAVADARRLLKFARAGLPTVLLGAFDQALTPGLPDAGEQAELRSLTAQLLALSNVRQITDKTLVGAAFAELGVTSDAVYSVSSTLLNAHRVTDDADFYYLCNGKHAETVKPAVALIDHDVTLRATRRKGSVAVPYLLDPWSGQVTRLAQYTQDGDAFTFRVTLQPGETLVVALGAPGLFGDRSGNRPHAVATDADSALFADGSLAVRAFTSGVRTTTLSTGRKVTTAIPEVPAAVPLDRWTLTVDDWQPGGTATTTTIVKHSLVLDALLPWSQIPELADVGGIGRYRTTVTLPKTWTSDTGALLRLGSVSDTCRVTVNGTQLAPVDRLNPVVDLGGHLRHGTNTIEVEVATPLFNRLRISNPTVFGTSARQSYGLVGPVQLTPYVQRKVG
ncbi:glycosyl hydrolase [Streptomyces sp. NPDC088847]|uniref:glycosyl hydrolase n=1 Tax=Streptomyces sp. NPDC088847 TaxID=3365909 RepID=UPI003810EA5F